jgi:hypothetical protein
MATVNTLEVKIVGDDSNLQSTLGGASLSVAKWGAAAVAAAAAATAALVRSGLQSADALTKQARQLNATSEELMKLRRAGDMAGVSQGQLDGTLRQLNTRLGLAIQGSGGAVDALARLGLSAQDLANTPLPDRIAKINQALQDHVPAAERAAVSAQLFGERGGQAMALIDPATIAQAAKQVDRLGGSLSDVESRMIEQANDSMSQMGVLSTNVSQRLALQFAPALQTIAEGLFGAAGEANGFRDVIEKGFNVILKITAEVVNIFDVMFRAIETGFRLTRMIIAKSAKDVVDNILAIVKAIDMIPTIDMSDSIKSLQQMSKNAQSWINLDSRKLKEVFTKPLAGDVFYGNVLKNQEKMRKSAEEASKAFEESRKILTGESSIDGTGTKSTTSKDATDSELNQFIADLEKRKEALRHSQMDEMGIEGDKYAQRLEQLRNFLEENRITHEQYNALLEEMSSQHNDVMANLSTEKDDGALEKFREAMDARLEKLRETQLTEEELEQERYLAQLEQLALFFEEKTELEEEYRMRREQLEEEHTHRMVAIAKREADERAKVEGQVQDNIRKQREAIVGLSIRLLQQLGSRNKIFALAAIALEKARAIAQIKMQTAVNASLAFGSQLILGDPSSLGRAKVAMAMANKLGAVQMGLVAATGLVEAAGVMSRGGASAGTAGGVPIMTQDVGGGSISGSGSFSGTAPKSNQVVNINLTGEVFGREQVRTLITEINEAVADGAVLRIA